MIKKCSLLVLTVLAAVSAVAHAAGRAPDHVFAGMTDNGLPAYVKLLSHNHGVEARFAYTVKCDSGDVYMLWNGMTRLPMTRGKFTFAREEDTRGPQITLHGRINKRSASGTWDASFTVRDDSGAVTDRCESGRIHWTLKATALGGQSSSGYPVALTLGKGKVRSFQMVSELKCQSGGSYFISTPYDDFPIGRGGRFGDSFTDTEAAGPGMQAHLTIRLAGKVGRSGASGTWHSTAVISDGSGRQVDSCDSGPLTWRVTQ